MVRTTIQIRFSDVDMAGHVHNAAYLQYFELGRIDFFKKKILDGAWDWEKRSLILARNEIDYKLPVLLEDELIVETSFESMGNTSITLSYIVLKNGEKCASGRSILVCFDYEQNSKISIPEEWKRKFEAL